MPQTGAAPNRRGACFFPLFPKEDIVSLENLKQRMPAYAKDIKLNLSNVASSTTLTEVQLWGAMLASALAERNPTVLEENAQAAAQPQIGEAWCREREGRRGMSQGGRGVIKKKKKKK